MCGHGDPHLNYYSYGLIIRDRNRLKNAPDVRSI